MSGSDGQMPRWTHKSLMIVIATMGTTAVQPYVWATPYAWNVAAGGNWSDITAAGWNNTDYPSAAGDTANIQKDIDANTTITIDINDATVSAMTLQDTADTTRHSWIIASSDSVNNKLTFDNGGSTATLAGSNAGSGGHQITAPIVLNSNLQVTAAQFYRINLDGVVSGSGKSITIGSGSTAGQVWLSAANTHDGGTILNAGSTLRLGNAAALGGGGLTINGGAIGANNGTITLNNHTETWAGDFSVSGASGTLNIGTGNVTLTGDRKVTVTNSTLIVGGVIGDGGNDFGLTYAVGQFGGILTLNGANTFSGGVTLTSTGDASTSPNAYFRIGNLGTSSAASALGTGTFTIGPPLKSGFVVRFDNTSGAAGTLSTNNAQVWNSSFDFFGSNNLHMGAGAVTLGASVTVNVQNGPSNNLSTRTLTIGGGVGDAGNGLGFTKTGPGILLLEGHNTYTGDTTVNAGTLTFASNGSLLMDINDASYSKLLGTGTLNLDGTLRLAVTGVTGEGTWMLVSANTLNEIYGSSFAVALAGSTDTPFAESDNIWTLLDGSNAWTFTESTGELSLAIVIPEPATMALIGLTFALLVPARRGARCGGVFH